MTLSTRRLYYLLMVELLRHLRRKIMFAGHFRSTVWDPTLIISQIICVQSFFYVSLGFWLFVVDIIGQFERSLEQVFDDVELNVVDNMGRVTVSAFLLNSLTCPLGLWYIIQRTKLCLDFTATCHLVHLIVCCVYMGRIPMTVTWWIVNVLCVTITTVVGEFLCMRTEMTAIPIVAAPKTDL